MDTVQRPSHHFLIRLLVEERQASGLRQQDVAKKLGRSQSWLAKVESGRRRIEVCELFDLARVIKFDPIRMIAKVARVAEAE